MMHASKNIKEITYWSVCPPEILCIIFKYLDPKSLTNCMLVNRKWKDIAEHIAKRYNLWEKIVENAMPNKGAAFRRKSRLDYRHLYKNSLLWNYIKSAELKHLNTCEVKDIKKIKVYNDNLILINGSHAFYYDVKTFTKVAEFECIDVDENDYMFVQLVRAPDNTTKLHLYDKINDSLRRARNTEPMPEVMNGTTLFKLELKLCYVLTKANVLWALTYRQGQLRVEFLGRSYGGHYDPIVDIHIWNDSVYVVTKWGIVWSVDSVTAGLRKAFKLKAPQDICQQKWLLFDRFSSVVKVSRDVSTRVTVQYNQSTDALMLQCAELSSAMTHDHVLFLGYNDGRVEIRLPRKNMYSPDPDKYFNIQEFSNDEDCAIVALNVYEIENSHILYVCTPTRVFQFQLSYPESVLYDVL